jgi:hypothetical protein
MDEVKARRSSAISEEGLRVRQHPGQTRIVSKIQRDHDIGLACDTDTQTAAKFGRAASASPRSIDLPASIGTEVTIVKTHLPVLLDAYDSG